MQALLQYFTCAACKIKTVDLVGWVGELSRFRHCSNPLSVVEDGVFSDENDFSKKR